MEFSKFGKYQVVEKIGEGGFGEVFKGRDPTLKRFVAIKTCKAASRGFLDRFLLEAEISARLQHPNIVTIHDFGYQRSGDPRSGDPRSGDPRSGDPEEIPYLVQEFLAGEDLDRKIRRRAAMDVATKVDILRQAAVGLRHAHHRGVVHRDVKPANLRVLEDGHVKIMDFGIAKLLSSEVELTQTGMTLGTARYQSPEQFQGGEIDLRADIFSFGVTAYELLTYEQPFDGDSVARIFYRITHEEPRPIRELWPECPESLERCVGHCLRKQPVHRYSDLAPVIGVLEAYCATVGSGSHPMTAVPEPGPPPPGPPPPPPPAAADPESRADGAARSSNRSPAGRIAALAAVALAAFGLAYAAGKLWQGGEAAAGKAAAGAAPTSPSPTAEGGRGDLPSTDGPSADARPADARPADAVDRGGTAAAVIVEPAAPIRKPIAADPAPAEIAPPPPPPSPSPAAAAGSESEPPAPPPDPEAGPAGTVAPPPPPPPTTVPAAPRRGVVVLYDSRNFGGRGETFGGDDPSLADNVIGNDSARSVQVDPGCRVELFEDVDYGGRATVLTSHRGTLRGTEVGNGEVSSLKVSCRPVAPAAGGRGAVLYVHGGFQGPGELFRGADPDLADNPVGDDAVSSVEVTPGCRVRLFRKSGYQGRETVLTADSASLEDSEVGNDEASSVRVECPPRQR